ncbi:hypothetical protein CHU95_08820 [Niveispirillum lacus]|uniref:Yip1 domain-containing protein n=1 Tax=Niveispirillum lacus TaxID=1981099 RepID=A0A255Z1C4_9PROT|nr:hypothetical protein [Niveispirillum lacus]OYQ35307.1 hypothetical protein CHU95_08820 [Niveispirillum lacus]
MSALTGALRLAALDKRGITLIDPSPLAAWRSLVLLVPLLLIGAIADLATLPEGIAPIPYLPLGVAVSAMQMTGYLLVVSRILETTGRDDRFAIFVSTYAWCSIVSSTVALVVLAVSLNASEPVANGIGLGFFMWNLYYGWFAVRSALGCSGAVAAGFVALEFLTVLATYALPLQLVLAAQG